MVTAYIGLGSNLDDPVQHIVQACIELAGCEDITLIKCSSLYRNPPMGPVTQPDYVNAVAEIATCLLPDALLEVLQGLEKAHGRVRTELRWGPRPLDLDILLYGEKSIKTKSLTIPHAGLYERAFVLYPLQEIAPDVQIPGHGSLQQLVLACDGNDLEIISDVALPQ